MAWLGACVWCMISVWRVALPVPLSRLKEILNSYDKRMKVLRDNMEKERKDELTKLELQKKVNLVIRNATCAGGGGGMAKHAGAPGVVLSLG